MTEECRLRDGVHGRITQFLTVNQFMVRLDDDGRESAAAMPTID
jgi:hypothetical protein